MSSPSTSRSPPILARPVSPSSSSPPKTMLPRSRPPRPQSQPSLPKSSTSTTINPADETRASQPQLRHAQSNLSTSSETPTTSSLNPPLTPQTSLSPASSSTSQKVRKNISSVSLSGGGGNASNVPQTLPRSSRTQPSTAASSTTSVNGLLGLGMGMTSGPGTGTGTGNGMMGGTGIGTPQTGASRMAMAAKRGQQGRDRERGEVDGIPGGMGSRVREDEEHPLSDRSLSARGYQTIHTLQHLFHLPNRWSLIRPLGQGAYGLVVSVMDSLSGEPVAVKCITRVFDKVILARRALREITLLRHFQGHENLTGLIDLDNVWDGYNEIYLYMEPMEADLHQIVRSGQALSNPHIQYFLYQLLRGMKYIHSANVIHRDLKPGNLLVNADCELKICDFGLARGYRPVKGEEDQQEEMKLTEYVATRWYRAPEVMLSNRRYTTAIDVWSIGCILAELLGGKPIFKGKDYVDQLNLILAVLGTPDEGTLTRVGSEKACMYLRTLPFCEPVNLYDKFPDADPDAVDLLSQLLIFDPSKRITVEEALQHPYVSAYHDPTDEPVCDHLFEKWEQVESLMTIEELREAITREINEFRAEVRDVVDEEDEGEEIMNGENGWARDGDYTLSPNMADPGSGVSTEKTSPLMSRSALGLSPMTASTPLPKSPGTTRTGTIPLPQTRKDREGSPSTPSTALSEESFNQPGSGRTSRRQSGHSLHRRPNSFLFSPMTGMTSLPGSRGVSGSQSTVVPMTSANGMGVGQQPGDGYFMHRTPRSRAASSNMGDNVLRPLLRQLSTVNLAEMGKEMEDGHSGEEVPPMTVSPSDAPPSEVPKNFSKLAEMAEAH